MAWTTRQILRLCTEHGFALCGVCGVEPSRWEDELRRWLARGRHGTMAYLAEHLDVRLDPALLLEGARSIVMVADVYARRGESPTRAARGLGLVARYAQGRDYHRVIKRRLHALADAIRAAEPSARARVFVDTAPVLERELAQRCGLGWIGKHTLLIHPRLGSYILLGGLATDIALEPTGRPVPDHCGTCTRCIDACPTGAIEPYSVDASRCISYLTIEHRGPIDPAFFPGIGDWVFGCDICQDVCPHNGPLGLGRTGGVEPPQAYRPRLESLDLASVLRWRAQDRAQALSGSAIKRATLAMLRRNAVIVAGNQGVCEDLIRRIASDPSEDPIVRDAAAHVLERRRG